MLRLDYHRSFMAIFTPVLIGLGVHAFFWGLALGLEAIFCDPDAWLDLCTGDFQAVSIPVATFVGSYLCQRNARGRGIGAGVLLFALVCLGWVIAIDRPIALVAEAVAGEEEMGLLGYFGIFVFIAAVMAAGWICARIMDMKSGRAARELVAAVRCDDVPRIRAWLRTKCDPNMVDAAGETLLHQCLSGAAARALVAAGADPNARDARERTPLHFAVQARRLDVIKSLLQHSAADPDAQDDQGRTPLHEVALSARGDGLADQEAGIALGIMGLANPDLQDSDGQTPWMLAETRGQEHFAANIGPNLWTHSASVRRKAEALLHDRLRDHGNSTLLEKLEQLDRPEDIWTMEDPALRSLARELLRSSRNT